MMQATETSLFSLRTVLVTRRILFRAFIEVCVKEKLKLKATYEGIQKFMYPSSSNINTETVQTSTHSTQLP
jgi:hypothetical protein